MLSTTNLSYPCIYILVTSFNPVSSAVPFWGQTTRIPGSVSPKRDCGTKGLTRSIGNRVVHTDEITAIYYTINGWVLPRIRALFLFFILLATESRKLARGTNNLWQITPTKSGREIPRASRQEVPVEAQICKLCVVRRSRVQGIQSECEEDTTWSCRVQRGVGVSCCLGNKHEHIYIYMFRRLQVACREWRIPPHPLGGCFLPWCVPVITLL